MLVKRTAANSRHVCSSRSEQHYTEASTRREGHDFSEHCNIYLPTGRLNKTCSQTSIECPGAWKWWFAKLRSAIGLGRTAAFGWDPSKISRPYSLPEKISLCKSFLSFKRGHCLFKSSSEGEGFVPNKSVKSLDSSHKMWSEVKLITTKY